jgi:hypothetical protein
MEPLHAREARSFPWDAELVGALAMQPTHRQRMSLADHGIMWAAQTRNPSGTYFHGVSWGTVGNNMAGGPDGLNVLAADGGTKTFFFTNGDYRLVANFSSGAAPAMETPGAANNAANDTWIDSWRCITSPLPMQLGNFDVWAKTHSIAIHWETLRETNTDYFLIERMDDEGGQFLPIAKKEAAGISTSLKLYDYIDVSPANGVSTYRISLADRDGQWSHSEMKKVTFYSQASFMVTPVPANDFIQFTSYQHSDCIIHIFDVLGQKKTDLLLTGNQATLDASLWPAGFYFFSYQEYNGQSGTGRFLISR